MGLIAKSSKLICAVAQCRSQGPRLLADIGAFVELKLLSKTQRLREIRLTRKRTRKHLKRGARTYAPPTYAPKIADDAVEAPRRINIIRGEVNELASFLRAVRKHVLTEGKKLTLDFKKTVAFSPAGTLLLFAELDRVVQLSPLPKPLTCVPPQSRRAREVMKQIGLFNVTKDSVDVVPERKDVVYWCATKGNNQDGNVAGPLIERVASTVNKSAAQKVEESGTWPGVSEAINNTTEHAYQEDRGDGHGHAPDTKWWMFTHVRDDIFYAAVCDLGMGYRRTVPKTIPEIFRNTVSELLLGTNPDARAIQTAMRYGVTSTKLDHRGKGSRDALSVLKTHGQGELLIASNTGWVHYRLDKGSSEPVATTNDLKVDIMGTIVWWRLPLRGVQ